MEIRRRFSSFSFWAAGDDCKLSGLLILFTIICINFNTHTHEREEEEEEVGEKKTLEFIDGNWRWATRRRKQNGDRLHAPVANFSPLSGATWFKSNPNITQTNESNQVEKNIPQIPNKKKRHIKKKKEETNNSDVCILIEKREGTGGNCESIGLCKRFEKRRAFDSD